MFAGLRLREKNYLWIALTRASREFILKCYYLHHEKTQAKTSAKAGNSRMPFGTVER